MIDVAALLRALQKAGADIAANKAPPSSTKPFAIADIAPFLEAAQAQLPGLIAAAKAHQGVITGLGDILDALKAEGVPWAGDLEAALYASPGLVTAPQAWIPTILGALQAFSPAPANDPVSPNSPTDFSRGR